MMKYHLLFIFIFLGSYELYCNPDSLKLRLSVAERTEDGELKAEVERALADYYYFEARDYDSARLYGKQLLQDYKNNNVEEKDLGYAYKLLGYVFVDDEEYETGLAYLDSALNLYTQTDLLLPVIQVHTNRGIAFNYIDSPDSAIGSFQKALQLSKELGDSSQIAINSLNLGIMQSFTGRYTDAVHSFVYALDIFGAIGDSSTMVNTYIELGDIYLDWKKYNQASQYYEQARKMQKHIAYDKVHVSLYDVLGYSKEQQDSLKVAENYYNLALKKSREIDYKSGIAQSLYRLGNLAKKKALPADAIAFYQKALVLEKQIGSTEDQAEIYNELANLYIVTGNYREVLIFLEMALSISNEYGLIRTKKNTYYQFYTYYKERGKSAEALKYYEKYQNLEDSIKSADIELEMEELREKYESAQKEQEIERLSAEKSLQKARIKNQEQLIVGLGAVFLLLIAVLILWFLQNRRKAELKQIRVHQQLFRAQLNPHFIFNALNAIKSYIQSHQIKAAANYLSDFSGLMRSILEGSSDEFTTLDEETEMLNAYLNLQQMRFKSDFRYAIQVDNKLKDKEVLLPSMFIQPFVENAVEHGIRKGGSFVEIEFKKKANTIQIDVKDDGPGIMNKTDSIGLEHRSRGMQILLDRRKLLKKSAKWDIEIRYEALNNEDKTGTLITIIIPYHPKFEQD